MKILSRKTIIIAIALAVLAGGGALMAGVPPFSRSDSAKIQYSQGPIVRQFNYLSANGNSNCSKDFMDSIAAMPDNKMIQGSCCGQMKLEKYKTQLEGLKKYAPIAQIPPDPYNVEASLAKQLLDYDKSITPAVGQQAVLDEAAAASPEKGYCCCKCWRWYVYEGLSKYLVSEQQFSAQQITDVLANSNGCGD